MEINPAFLDNLEQLARYLEVQETLDSNLGTMAAMAGRLLQCRNCSIMLLKNDPGSGEKVLRVRAHHGTLTESAYDERVTLETGIAGHVASTGKSLLVEDIKRSPFAHLARHGDGVGSGFISVAVTVGEEVIGVLNFNSRTDGHRLNSRDLGLAKIAAMVVGKSIHVHRLQRLLKTHYLPLVLARDIGRNRPRTLTELTQDPDHLVRRLAKSVYEEMRVSDFGCDYILTFATEMVSQVISDIKTKGYDFSKVTATADETRA